MGVNQMLAGKAGGGGTKRTKKKSTIRLGNSELKKRRKQKEIDIADSGMSFTKRVKVGNFKDEKPLKHKNNEIVGKTFNKHMKLGNAGSKGPSKQKDSNTENVEMLSSRKLEKKSLIDKRKRHSKPHYELGKEVGVLWEKLRQRNLDKTERSSLISGILEKMKGRIPEMVTSHITSRVLQTCIKYCSSAEKIAIYEELRPQFLMLARNTYAHHLVVKMLDAASKDQLKQMISSLHGNVVAFLRHPVGSAVVEHAYKLANSIQKKELVAEFFSPEYRLFKGIITKGQCSLVDLLENEAPSKRASVLEHMTASLQPIMEKGIVDHSILHRALVEYLSIANKTIMTEVVQQLSGPLLIRMIHTKDGAKVGAICVGAGSRKERKKIIKGLKGNAMKVACDEHGSEVLLAILDVVDDTELINKCIISELAKNVKEVVLHKYARRVLLHLLSPYNCRYFSIDVLTVLQSLHKFSNQKKAISQENVEEDKIAMPSKKDPVTRRMENNNQKAISQENVEEDKTEKMIEGIGMPSKKNPFTRRMELLKASLLAEKVAEVCSNHAGELLRSPLGKDVIYEVAKGGNDGIMWHVTLDRVSSVHKAIADLGALPRDGACLDQVSDEHVFEHYHSSRTIRRLILDPHATVKGIAASSFSSVLWNRALKGNCRHWANGHSEKIVSALQQCNDLKVKNAAMIELQPLLDSGLLQRSSVIPNAKGIKRKRSLKAE